VTTDYAAYALLENLGCRWFFPADWGEVIPEKKTLTVPELNIRSKPDFAMRVIRLMGAGASPPQIVRSTRHGACGSA